MLLCCSDKHHTKKQLGEERVYFSTQISVASGEAKVGTQGRNLEVKN